eukprot:g639.t1
MWSRLSSTSSLFTAVSSIDENNETLLIKFVGSVADVIPSFPKRRTWEPELFRFVGGKQYFVIIQYNDFQYCQLKLNELAVEETTFKYECTDCEVDVEYPSEFSDVAGEGFASTTLSGNKTLVDGPLKALAVLSSAGKPVKRKKQKNKPKKLKSGHNLYSALGTIETKMRDFDPMFSSVVIDETKFEDYVTTTLQQRLAPHFKLCARVHSKGKNEEHIPVVSVLEVFDTAKLELTELQRSRVSELARLSGSNSISFLNVMDILNRVYNEQEMGFFHMTVKELMNIFDTFDVDQSGLLEASEIHEILSKLRIPSDVEKVKTHMEQINRQTDYTMDFEDFLGFCTELYTSRGGRVVANRAGFRSFNQTRILIENISSKIERHHLTIEHLNNEFQNYEEQNEIMDSIQEHSGLQRELNRVRDEKMRLRQLKREMEKQHEGWLRDIQAIHQREKRALSERVQFLESQRDKSLNALNFAKDCFETKFGIALDEVKKIRDAFSSVLDFHENTIERTHREAANFKARKRLSVERLTKYKGATSGSGNSVFHQDCYNAGKAAFTFLQTKTSALEKWLIARTHFATGDREKYLKRVNEVKEIREEFAENAIVLAGELKDCRESVVEMEGKYEREKARNEKLRSQLTNPQERKENTETARELVENIKKIQKEITSGKQTRLNWEKKLYPKTHQLNLERHKIRMLQVELGEIMILLENVKHHVLVEKEIRKKNTEM